MALQTFSMLHFQTVGKGTGVVSGNVEPISTPFTSIGVVFFASLDFTNLFSRVVFERRFTSDTNTVFVDASWVFLLTLAVVVDEKA